jgi:transposase
MSDGKKRTVHSAEFKAKVGMEAVRGVKTLNEIGQQYGVHPVVVGQWKKELIERAATLFDRKRGPKPAAYADEERLYGEIGRLKMELDWLKKSPDYERRNAKGLDRPRRGTGDRAAMRTGRGGASHLLRTADATRGIRGGAVAVRPD